MGWVKAVFTLHEIGRALDLPNKAWLRAQQCNFPIDFEVFSGFEFGGKSIEGARFVLWFTPRAADDCEDILMDYHTQPCEEPDRNQPYFGTAYRSQPPILIQDLTGQMPQ
jgi:hypothetical protein